MQCAGNKPTSETRGITADSIKIGALGTVTGATDALWGDAALGAEARFDRANAQGGVNGRKIDFIGMSDDGLNPTTSAQQAEKLAEQDDVFAVAPLLSDVTNYFTTFCQDVVPYVGWGFNPTFCNTSVGFGFDGCLVTGSKTEFTFANSSKGAGIGQLLPPGSDKTIALIGNDDSSARLGISELAAGDKATGLKVVYAQNNLPDDAPLADPGPVIHQILTSDNGKAPAAVVAIADFSNTSSIVQGLVASGYKGRIIDAVGYDPRLASFKPFNDTYVTLLWAPFESSTVPFIQQMNADLDKYEPGAARSLIVAAGYISADFLIAALQATGRNLTVSSFLNTLNGDHYTYQQPGFLGMTYWPLNHVIGTSCGTVVQLSNEKYRQIAPLACTNLLPAKG